MQTTLAILLGKAISYLSKFFAIGGGSAAPGLYALKLNPELVTKLSRKIPRNVVITGTNGKTTTARMLAHFAKESGLKVIRNHTGSNLERGIASALLEGVKLGHLRGVLRWHLVKLGHLRGVLRWHLSFDLGIWELDEAAFNSVAPKLNPNIVIFLNVSRDQLDRYGEVDKVVNRWCQTISKLDPKTVVLINRDEPDLSKLKNYFKGKVVQFGKRNFKNIKTKGLEGSSFKLQISRKSSVISLPLPGLYNIYNAVAAAVATYHLDLPIQRLSNFQPAFGRVEKFSLPGQAWERNGYIFLIKNPAGATQVFQTIAPQIKKSDRLLLALNDNLADGTDVSWIWDANFESLRNSSRALRLRSGSREYIYISGTRAADLAVRLKYAGFDSKQIKVEPNLQKALKQAKAGLKAMPAGRPAVAGRQGRLFILPTYTAMLEIQKILAKIGVKGHYWNE